MHLVQSSQDGTTHGQLEFTDGSQFHIQVLHGVRAMSSQETVFLELPNLSLGFFPSSIKSITKASSLRVARTEGH